MKVGAENKKELKVMIVLLAIAIPFCLYMFRDMIFGSASAANVPSSLPPAAANKTNPPPLVRDASDPRFRTDILEASRKVQYVEGRNIFRMEAIPIPTPKPVRTLAEIGPPAPPTPTPTPPPPPIPITYYGFASKPGEPKRVFLQKKDDPAGEVFVAAQGDIVARRYRVAQITPNSVTMEDVITNNRQPIPLTPKQ